MPELLATQKALKELLLEPSGKQNLTLSGIATEKLSLYGNLLRGTISSCLEGIYPHTRAFLKTQNIVWEPLVESFRREYPNPSYMLLYAVEQWPVFLTRQEFSKQWPWLSEIALYEWQEALVQNLPAAPLPEKLTTALPKESELDALCPFWNRASVLTEFKYPVTRLLGTLVSENYQLSHDAVSPETTSILIYRDPKTFKARFFVLNALTAALFKTLDATQSYGEGFEKLIAENSMLQSMPKNTVTVEALKLLAQCRDKGILLGSFPLG